MKERAYQAHFGILQRPDGPAFGVAPALPVLPREQRGQLNPGLFSSLSPEWATPQGVFDLLDRLYQFDLDACATPENAKCARFFTAAQDALQQPWTGRVFLNPPYGRVLPRWLRKAYQSAQAGATVVCLIPARTDTAWWHDYVSQGQVFFIRGRLRFGAGMGPAPFPSAVVVFTPPAAGRELRWPVGASPERT
jgi:site-specific DNA-methyltransferase (adenine-specific)